MNPLLRVPKDSELTQLLLQSKLHMFLALKPVEMGTIVTFVNGLVAVLPTVVKATDC